MSGIAKPLLILLSIALNGAFVAAYLSHTLPAGCTSNSEPHMDCPLLDKIGLTADQRTEIGPRLVKFRAAALAQCKKIGRLRGELINLLAEDEPCRRAIGAKQAEIVEGQRKMQELVVEQILAEKATLTAQQQKSLFDLIRVQCDCQGASDDCCEDAAEPK